MSRSRFTLVGLLLLLVSLAVVYVLSGGVESSGPEAPSRSEGSDDGIKL